MGFKFRASIKPGTPRYRFEALERKFCARLQKGSPEMQQKLMEGRCNWGFGFRMVSIGSLNMSGLLQSWELTDVILEV